MPPFQIGQIREIMGAGTHPGGEAAPAPVLRATHLQGVRQGAVRLRLLKNVGVVDVIELVDHVLEAEERHRWNHAAARRRPCWREAHTQTHPLPAGAVEGLDADASRGVRGGRADRHWGAGQSSRRGNGRKPTEATAGRRRTVRAGASCHPGILGAAETPG